MAKKDQSNKKIPIIEQIYYFDRIRINFYLDAEIIRDLWKNKVCNNRVFGNIYIDDFIRSTKGRPPKREDHYKKIKNFGWKCQMEVIAPNAIILDRLCRLHNLIVEEEKKRYHHFVGEERKDEDSENFPYKISYVELAKDCIVNSIPDAIDLSKERFQNLRMKWMYKEDDFYDHRDAKKIDLKKAYPGASSYIVGGYPFRHSGYARESKVALTPCSHGEFRIRKAKHIKKYLKVENLQDFSNFPFESKFNELSRKYLYNYDIDVKKIGKCLLGLKSKRKISRKKEKKCEVRGEQFLKENKIKNYIELENYIKNEANELEDPLKEKYFKAKSPRS